VEEPRSSPHAVTVDTPKTMESSGHNILRRETRNAYTLLYTVSEGKKHSDEPMSVQGKC
jgi:hypothetical protein